MLTVSAVASFLKSLSSTLERSKTVLTLKLEQSFLKRRILSLFCSKPPSPSPFHREGNLDFCIAPAVAQIPILHHNTCLQLFHLYGSLLCLSPQMGQTHFLLPQGHLIYLFPLPGCSFSNVRESLFNFFTQVYTKMSFP